MKSDKNTTTQNTTLNIWQQQKLYREIKRLFAKPEKITGSDNIMYRVQIDGMLLTVVYERNHLVDPDFNDPYSYTLKITGNHNVLNNVPGEYTNSGYIAKRLFDWYEKVCDPRKTVTLSILDKVYLYNIFKNADQPVIKYGKQNYMQVNGLQLWVKEQSGKREDPNRPLKGPIKFHNYEMGIRGRDDNVGYLRTVPAAVSIFNKQMYKMMTNKWVQEKSSVR